MFELGALLSLRRAVPHLGSQIKEAETIFQYNLCPLEFAQFYVTRLDYWIVRICSPSWKWCGPEITDRKENGSWVYLPMWQGNNMVHILFCSYFLSLFFFFLSNRAPLGFSMNFWYLSHTEKFWRAVTCLRRIYGAVKKLNCGNTFYLCHDQIPSQPSLLCVCLKLFSKRWHKLSRFHKQNVQPGACMGALLKLLG